MKKPLIPILVIALVIAYFYTRPEPEPAKPAARGSAPTPSPAAHAPPVARHEAEPSVPPIRMPAPIPRVVKIVEESAEPKQLALRYKIINGLYVVQGDVVAGVVPKGENPTDGGLVAMDPLKLWPSRTIPYHIQPDVPNPDRILQALEMFQGTVIQFVKYESGDIALVFENGATNCLSYVGHVTAKQPIFLSPDCSPADIAHEILHALGFVHEQNRADRDNFVDVKVPNIEEPFLHNFDKLPPDYMKVSGLAAFDYQSLMMYPPWMFAKPGQVTMEPLQRDQLIAPKAGLSAGDIERVNKAYQALQAR